MFGCVWVFSPECTQNGTVSCRTVYILELHGLVYVTPVCNWEVLTFKYLCKLFCHLAKSHGLDVSQTTSGLCFIWPKDEQCFLVGFFVVVGFFIIRFTY